MEFLKDLNCLRDNLCFTTYLLWEGYVNLFFS